MDDPYKLPLPTIPHKTMVVHGTPRSASGVLLHAGSPNGATNFTCARSLLFTFFLDFSAQIWPLVFVRRQLVKYLSAHPS